MIVPIPYKYSSLNVKFAISAYSSMLLRDCWNQNSIKSGSMGQGRGSCITKVAVLAILVIVCSPSCSLAATHVVGDSQGWGFSVSYADWSNGKTFAAGDTLGLSHSLLFSLLITQSVNLSLVSIIENYTS